MFKKVFALLLITVYSVIALGACDTGKGKEEESVEFSFNEGDYIKVVYFHGDERCKTCLTIEEYSKDAVTKGFAKEIEDGKVTWETINYDDEGQEYLMDKYELISQSLILIHVKDGEQAEWKNLQKVWELTHSKEEFLEYVDTEVKKFLDKL